MINDLDYIKFFLNKENYTSYFSEVDLNIFNRECVELIKGLGKFYKDFPEVEHMTVTEYRSWYLQFGKKFNEGEVEIYKEVFCLLDKREALGEKIILRSLRERKAAQQILEILDSGQDICQIGMLVEKLNEVKDDTHFIEQRRLDRSFIDMYGEYNSTSGYSWGFDMLDKNIGLCDPMGYFLGLAAAPGAGKSSFTVALACNIAKQLHKDKKVLWFCNENISLRWKKRALNYLFNVTNKEIEARIKEGADPTKKYLEKLGGDKIMFFDVHFDTITDIHKIIKGYKESVGLIVFDMLDKISLTPAILKHCRTTDDIPDKLYDWALGISCTYASVIATSQTSAGDYNKKYPPLEAMKGSKTAKQGSLSTALMMGHIPGSSLRYFTSPKNKYGESGDMWKGCLDFDQARGQFKEV